MSLNVAQPDYAKAVSGFVKSVPVATFRTYLRWRAIHAAASSLTKAFVDEDFRFQQLLTGAKVMEPRWRRCVRAADVMMGEALGRTFAKTALGADGKAAVEGMVDDLLASMGDDIDHVAWMDDPTRAKAKGKLATFAKEIGYPSSWRKYDALRERPRPTTWGTCTARAPSRRSASGTSAGKPSDRQEWDMTPTIQRLLRATTSTTSSLPGGILPEVLLLRPPRSPWP